MRSLRGRLVAILLAVALAGMLVLAVGTFATQRAFLYDRVDTQLAEGFGAVRGQILFAQQSEQNSCRGHLVAGDFNPPVPNTGGPSGASGSLERGGPPGFSLPPGTYGAVLDRSGNVLAECVFGFDDSGNYLLPNFSGVTLDAQARTLPTRGDGGEEFRAAARTTPSGDQIVVAVPLSETRQTINRLIVVEVVVIAVVLTILGLAAWLLVGIGLRPLDRMARTADAIAGGDLTHRVEPASEKSEIGRLGLALNRMLQRLEQAFGERETSERRLRQFLADASHELRTPLVSIRGYAELHRMGASNDPAEVDRSMQRIEQEATRMGVLVADMLALARLDETVEREHAEIDLGEIALGAVRDARVASPERSIELSSEGDLRVIGEADQLQQVIANLLRNATVHTPQDTAIEVAATRSGDEVRIDVRDHGPGLPPGDHRQLFQRFWRAERGRARGKDGSGLGLAIVAEIVAAHKGHVQARDADGGGAVFSVWLPAATPAPPAT